MLLVILDTSPSKEMAASIDAPCIYNSCSQLAFSIRLCLTATYKQCACFLDFYLGGCG